MSPPDGRRGRPWPGRAAAGQPAGAGAGRVDVVVPAGRPITGADLPASGAGHGCAADFPRPGGGRLFSEQKQGPPQPQLVAAPDEWMAALSRIPLLYQPGEAWLY